MFFQLKDYDITVDFIISVAVWLFLIIYYIVVGWIMWKNLSWRHAKKDYNKVKLDFGFYYL